jgi:uncharacterized coiled-coil DUF342 family protein
VSANQEEANANVTELTQALRSQYAELRGLANNILEEAKRGLAEIDSRFSESLTQFSESVKVRSDGVAERVDGALAELRRTDIELGDNVRAVGLRLDKFEQALADNSLVAALTADMREHFAKLRRKIDERMNSVTEEVRANATEGKTLAEQTVRTELAEYAGEVRDLKLAVAAADTSAKTLSGEFKALRTLVTAPRPPDPEIEALRTTLDDLVKRTEIYGQQIEQQAKTTEDFATQLDNIQGALRAEVKNAVQHGYGTFREEILRRCDEKIADSGGSQAMQAVEELQHKVDSLARRDRGSRGPDVQAFCEENIHAVRTELELGLEAAKRERAALRSQIEETLGQSGSRPNRRTEGDRPLSRGSDDVRSEIAEMSRQFTQRVEECREQCNQIKAGQERGFARLRTEIDALKPASGPIKRRNGAI